MLRMYGFDGIEEVVEIVSSTNIVCLVRLSCGELVQVLMMDDSVYKERVQWLGRYTP